LFAKIVPNNEVAFGTNLIDKKEKPVAFQKNGPSEASILNDPFQTRPFEN
jgi:hypothetical protein